jgi:NAD-dependent dihydropyrimidine dehydrogenase PreA subunit
MAWLTAYPREKVEWYPTINSDKCVKCGMCMNCGKNVYDWTEKGAVVARPYQCVVGCTTCANLCLGNAITFQNIEDIRALYKKEGIWSKVKKKLQEEGKLAYK